MRTSAAALSRPVRRPGPPRGAPCGTPSPEAPGSARQRGAGGEPVSPHRPGRRRWPTHADSARLRRGASCAGEQGRRGGRQAGGAPAMPSPAPGASRGRRPGDSTLGTGTGVPAGPEARRTPAPAPPLTEVRLVGAALQPHAPRGALDQEVPDQLAGQVARCRGTRDRARRSRPGRPWEARRVRVWPPPGAAEGPPGLGLGCRTGGRRHRVDGWVPSTSSSDQAGRAPGDCWVQGWEPGEPGATRV